MCELGERLRKAREARGFDLKDLARTLRIRPEYLEALEACRFEALPEPVLARAYLKRYARALGLDPAPLLALWPGEVPRTIETLPRPQPRRRRVWPWVLLVFLVLGAAGWWLGRPAPAPPAEAPEVAAPAAPEPPRYQLEVESEPKGARVYLDGYFLGETPVRLKVEAGERVLRVEAEGYQPFEKKIRLDQDRHLKVSLSPVARAPEKKEAPKKPTLVLRVRARSWIRVTTPEGKKLYEATAPPGTELSFPLPVVVRTGNAGGVVIVINGEEKGPLGKPGEVVTRRFP